MKVAASIPDLASIANYIGGDQVEAFSIAKANGNPHFVEVLPSYMIQVSRAAIYLKVGLGLDGWADAIIEGSRNDRVKNIDCSKNISVLEKPTGKVDASLGDVHPQGNPHYWLDPANGAVIASNIAEGFIEADPSHAALYQGRLEQFKAENSKRIVGWKNQLSGLSGKSILTYHSSWIYFANAFNLKIVEHVEPFPGIPPSGQHLKALVDKIKSEKITLLLQEPYFPDDAPKFLSRATGIIAYRFTPSCDGVSGDAYWKHFADIVTTLSSGVK
jgi:zinc/manganese transport system substrate-binding protein